VSSAAAGAVVVTVKVNGTDVLVVVRFTANPDPPPVQFGASVAPVGAVVSEQVTVTLPT
jgi:hypothetical protein